MSRFQTLKWLLCPAWDSLSLSTPGQQGVGVSYLFCRLAWPWSATNIFEPLSSQTNPWPSPELTWAKGHLCWLWASNSMGHAFHFVNHFASSLADYSWLQKPSSSIATQFSLSFRTIPSVKQFIPYTHATLILFFSLKMFILSTFVSIIAICVFLLALPTASQPLYFLDTKEPRVLVKYPQICAQPRQTWPVTENGYQQLVISFVNQGQTGLEHSFVQIYGSIWF